MSEIAHTIQRLAPIGAYVGKLEELWQFPSDHLPIGLSLSDLHIASWNVLDSKYMWWITKRGSQGLQKSLLVDQHLYISKTKLTLRDQHIVDLLLQMLTHESHPRSIIALQECGIPFLSELNLKLPPNFTVLAQGGNGIIIDTSRFEIIHQEALNIFLDEPKRVVQNVILRELDTRAYFRIINVHIPGDPARPGKKEFTDYLASAFAPSLTTVALGDMNFNELEMEESLAESFRGTASPYALYTPYCTNISPQTLFAKAIDHFMVYLPLREIGISLSTPKQLFSSLQQSVSLLNQSHNN